MLLQWLPICVWWVCWKLGYLMRAIRCRKTDWGAGVGLYLRPSPTKGETGQHNLLTQNLHSWLW
jgi:hypothetical protein